MYKSSWLSASLKQNSLTSEVFISVRIHTIFSLDVTQCNLVDTKERSIETFCLHKSLLDIGNDAQHYAISRPKAP